MKCFILQTTHIIHPPLIVTDNLKIKIKWVNYAKLTNYNYLSFAWKAFGRPLFNILCKLLIVWKDNIKKTNILIYFEPLIVNIVCTLVLFQGKVPCEPAIVYRAIRCQNSISADGRPDKERVEEQRELKLKEDVWSLGLLTPHFAKYSLKYHVFWGPPLLKMLEFNVWKNKIWFVI